MTLSKRVRNLESQCKAKDALVLIISIGDDMRSAQVEGVGHMERNPTETKDDFLRRVYATKAAGCSLDDLTDSDRRAAFERGDGELATSPPETITIGGEFNETF